MALTRKFLSALGIDEEKAEQIIQAHVDTVDPIKSERDKYKAEAEKVPALTEELKTLKEKAEGEDPYKEKFEKLQKEHNDFKAEVEAKATTEKKETAFKAMLKDIGIPEKRIDSVMRVAFDGDKIELDDGGKVKEGDKLKESLKTEWADFIPTTKKEGANTATPPANTGKAGTMTKEQIRAIADPVARQKAMLENPTLFGLPDTTST